MLFTDVNEQYTIWAHAYVIGWCPTQCWCWWWLQSIAERTMTTTTTTVNSKKKNQLLQSNWFWTLSFTYSTYFLRTHIAHASTKCSGTSRSFRFPFNKMCHKMLNLHIDSTQLLLLHDHCMRAYSLIQQYFRFICKTDWIETANVLVFTQSRQYVNIMWNFELAFFLDDSAYNVRHGHGHI